MKKNTNSIWTHMRRSPYQTLAAILTMFLTFLLGGVFALTTGMSLSILRYFEGKPQLTVFFMEKAGKPEADVLKITLEGTGKVASTKFVSKDDALAIPRFLSELEPVIKEADGVEEVIFQKDVVDALLSWTNAIRIIGGTLAGLLAIDSLLIIMTVIGLKIAMKKEEIEILKLIGATQWYIRKPFVIEGGIYGIVGAFFAWLIMTILLLVFRSSLLSFLGAIPVIHTLLINPLSSVFLISAGAFLGVLGITGFLLGAIGSLITLNRYIKF